MDGATPRAGLRSLTGEPALFALTTALVAAGALDRRLWFAGTGIGLAAAVAWLVASARRREPTVDVIAVLALLGSWTVDEPLAGAVVAWMLATGRLLEQRAQARARHDLSLLVARAPRTARLRTPDGVEEVDAAAVRRGDVLVVGPGEVVPVDGRATGPATLDESALTGEALPVEHGPGDEIRSGAVCAGGVFELVASSAAAESTYARIVRLVEQAQASTAPFVRAADRVATVFVPFTLLVAGGAWLVSGDAVRAVAVLVVATPCPLLLAAPIAVVSGLSRAARRGVVIKGGAVLERLAGGRVLLLDKTGTLTRGRPALRDVVLAEPPAPHAPDVDTLLRCAASLDQVSPHVLADAVVTAGRARELSLTLPADVTERHGKGIAGTVDGVAVRVGTADWAFAAGAATHAAQGADREPAWARRVRRRAAVDGTTAVFVAVAGVPAGALHLEDPLRPDAPRTIRALRRAGFRRVVLVSGDRADVAQAVGRIVGVDAVHAEQDPPGKLAVVRDEARHGATVMVGDGVNDAPALALADVGVALAARGATASSQAADVVLTVDRVDRLADAVAIAARARRIAVQAVLTGMSLSVVAMGAAAAGWLPPTAGALLQEGIDVLSILVALRAVVPPKAARTALTDADVALMSAVHAQHDAVRALVEEVRTVADGVTSRAGLAAVGPLLGRLETELLPHEQAEEERLYPVVARVLGGDDPIGAMSRTHAEIAHQVWRLRRIVEPGSDGLPEGLAEGLPDCVPGRAQEGAPDDADDADGADEHVDPAEVQRLLYGLYAILRLHNAQEEEGMFSLLPG